MSPLVVVYRLVAREIVTRGRLIAVAGLGGALIATAFVIRQSSVSDPLTSGSRLISNLGLAVVVPIVVLLFSAASLGDLRDDKTMVYLWLTPTPPWVVPAAAVAASFTVCLPLVLGPTVIAAIATGAGGELVTGTIVSVTLVTFAYAGVFTALGLVTRRTLMWGLGYILIWEGFVALAGAGAARFALRAHARSILADITGTSLRLADLISPGAAQVTLVVVGFGALAAAVRRYRVMTID